MDRLTALIGLRLRLSLRQFLRARASLAALVLAVPGTLIFSGLLAVFLFSGVRGLAAGRPEALLPVLSAGATLVGLFVALSPLLTGVGAVETPDAARLAHFPVPLGTVVLASTFANLLQPAVLAQALLSLAVALSLAGSPLGALFALAGVALTHLLVIVAAQLVGLVLYGLSRNRRLLDLLILTTLPLGVLFGLGPLLILALGPTAISRVLRIITTTDAFVFSPFAWGMRAAAHGGRGEVGLFLLWSLAGVLALAGAVALSAVLMGRIHSSAWNLSPAFASRARAGSTWSLPGSIGALFEKDLRTIWREPAAKASVFLGLVGPLVLLVLLTRGVGSMSPAVLVSLALFIGISPLGANAFGFERRGVQLLLTLPMPRGRILVAKNLAHWVVRAPALGAFLFVFLVVAPLPLLAPTIVVVGATWLVASGVDNLHSILFPVTLPGPERDPYAKSSGGRGLGAALVGAAFIPAALVVASPFVFLAWLPLLLDTPQLSWVALPLSLAGALATYALLVAGSARVLVRREPEFVARILGDA